MFSPGRRVRVLEIGHEHFRAGVERVDHHLAIGRPGDLDAAVLQIRRDRRAGPIAFPNRVLFPAENRGSRRGRVLLVVPAGAANIPPGGPKARCNFATKASASGVRISAKAGVTAPSS